MTTQEGGGAGIVSITPDNTNAGEANAANNGQQNSGAGQGAAFADIISGLSQENQEFVKSRGWKDDLNNVINSHRELEKAFSTRGQQPNNNNGQQTNGGNPTIPTSPAGYEFKLPETMPKEGFYDKNLAETFKTWAHNAKLDTATAQKLHDHFVEHAASAMSSQTTAAAESLNKRVGETFDALTKEWGSPETPQFKHNVELTRRAIHNLHPNLKTALKETGLIIDQNGQEVITNAVIFQALQKAGAKMFAEDEVFGTAAAAENPFDAKKPNLEKQGKVIRENPELARTLIKAAGAEGDWAWFLNKKQ